MLAGKGLRLLLSLQGFGSDGKWEPLEGEIALRLQAAALYATKVVYGAKEVQPSTTLFL